MPRMTHLDFIEIQPVSHCTLACASCHAGSPQREEQAYSADEYGTCLDMLARFATWGGVSIAGGEPFLHSDLAAFIVSIRREHPVDILTNGFWMLRKDWMEFARPILSLCRTMVLSRYPPYVNKLGIPEWNRRIEAIRSVIGINVVQWHPENPTDLVFTRNTYHEDPLPTLNRCPMQTCYQLIPGGQLARCPLGRWHHLIPNRTEAFVAAYDRSGFYDLARDGEGFAEWARPESFEACHYCGLATGAMTAEAWTTA